MEQKNEEDSPEGALDELDMLGDEADTLIASEGVEVDGSHATKLWETSKQVSKRSEGSSQKDLPGRPGEEPEEPGGETAVPGNAYTYQEGPRGDASDDSGGTNVPSRDTWPGGQMGELDGSRGVEVIQDCEIVVNGAASSARHDSKRVKTRLLARDKGQHQRFTCNEIVDAPEPSTPLPNDPK